MASTKERVKVAVEGAYFALRGDGLLTLEAAQQIRQWFEDELALLVRDDQDG